jgi:alanine or glycine:cation symporter, AGCS family
MPQLFSVIDAINGFMLSVPMLLALLGTGVLFTLWSGFCQYRSLTHGITLISGKGEVSGKGAGALTHFQALSAALSGTVGLGNIAGVAIAVEFGGPGAVFWMWMVGLAGMAIKSTEVTLSLLYRDVSNPDDPHGGAMFVCRNGLSQLGAGWKKIGAVAGVLFTLAMILFAVTGGNMFQAWAVADTTQNYFGVPQWVTGLIMAALVGTVILGGIKRIGSVTDKLVPLMCGTYVLCGIWVLIHNSEHLPAMIRLIFASAFAPSEASGAFTGALMGSAFIFGMKRALFSSESGLGTAPMAHSAVKTPEPVTEGVVAGLEPFIDTLVVCTITALVILSSGVWNRGPVGTWDQPVAVTEVTPGHWQPDTTRPPAGDWHPGDQVFVVAQAEGAAADQPRTRIYGAIIGHADQLGIAWTAATATVPLHLAEQGLFENYRGSTLAARAFDSARPGLGQWMVTLAVWLFALSTMITYAYYGEKGVVYLGGGSRAVTAYRWVWCTLIVVTCLGFIDTNEQLDSLSTVGMGFMLAVNLPVMWILGSRAMAAYHDYFRRLKAGQLRHE